MGYIYIYLNIDIDIDLNLYIHIVYKFDTPLIVKGGPTRSTCNFRLLSWMGRPKIPLCSHSAQGQENLGFPLIGRIALRKCSRGFFLSRNLDKDGASHVLAANGTESAYVSWSSYDFRGHWGCWKCNTQDDFPRLTFEVVIT